VYGVADARARLILASLDEVHDGPLCEDNIKTSDRLLDDIDRIPNKPDMNIEQIVRLDPMMCVPNDTSREIILKSDVVVPKPVKDAAKGIIATFHTSYGNAIYNPNQSNVLDNRENMESLHKLFTDVHTRACVYPTSSATFRTIVASWLLITKLSCGAYNELLEQAVNVLTAIEELPGLTRMIGNSHKCHIAFVAFRLFNQAEYYDRLRRVYNSYSNVSPTTPPYEELTSNHYSACDSPFCRSICTKMWHELKQHVDTVEVKTEDVFDILPESIRCCNYSPLIHLTSGIKHIESAYDYWEDSPSPVCKLSPNSMDSVASTASLNSLLNELPDNWFDNDFFLMASGSSSDSQLL
jgi:hypothetical protein